MPRRRHKKSSPLEMIASTVLAAAFVVYAGWHIGAGFGLVGCGIKGNINRQGERIYHVPGDRYYWATRINFVTGERWFCAPRAAEAAGWRRSRW